MDNYIRSLISRKLEDLNNEKHGPQTLEKVAKLVVEQIHPEVVVCFSSGQDCGGDGGIDSRFILPPNGKRIRIACSIEKRVEQKLKNDIERRKDFDELWFFTNQVFAERQREPYCEQKITVFDKNDIIEYAIKNPAIQKELSLSVEKQILQKDLQKANFQLEREKEQIKSYIPRKARFGNKNETLFEFICKNEHQITVLEATAGQGKTCALKRLCYDVIFGETISPPVFYIDLSIYQPNCNYIKTTIDTITNTFEPSVGDCILLLDGADEIPNQNIKILISEISSFLANECFNRKIVISQRSNTHDCKIYEEITSCSSPVELRHVWLEPLANTELQNFINQQELENSETNHLLGFLSGFGGIDSIFVISNTILFYKSKNKLPNNIVDLMEFLCEKEIKQQFHNKNIERPSVIEEIAFDMTLSQKPATEAAENANLPIPELRFSHKSIQEYFAAKYLSRKSVKEIKKLTTSYGIVIPHLTNTIGHLLNILHSNHENFQIGNELKNELLKENTNIYSILQIETTFISPEERRQLFLLGVKEYREYFDEIENDSGIISFFKSIVRDEKNNNWIIEKIKEEADDNRTVVLHLLLNTARRNTEDINKPLQKALVTTFYDWATNAKKLPEYPTYCLSYSTAVFDEASILTDKQISDLIQKLNNPGIFSWFDNLCELINRREKAISKESISLLLDKFIEIDSLTSGNNIASYAPLQIKGGYKDKVTPIIPVDRFFALITRQSEKNHNLIWTILEKMSKKEYRVCCRLLNDSDFSPVLCQALTHVIHTNINEESKSELWSVLFGQNENLHSETKVSAFVQLEAPIELILDFISISMNTNPASFWIAPYQSFFYKRINEESQAIEKLLKDKRIPNEKILCFLKPEQVEPFEKLLSRDEQVLFESMQKATNENEKNHQIHEELLKTSFHIAFQPEKFRDETKKAFGLFSEGIIKRENHVKILYREEPRHLISPFVAKQIEAAFDSTKKSYFDFDSFITWWNSFGDWGVIQAVYRYIKNGKEVDVFTKEEENFIREWITKTLTTYPLSFEKSPRHCNEYVNKYMTLHRMQPVFKELMKEHKTALTPYIRYCENLAYSYSPNLKEDYIHSYFTDKEIVEYLYNNKEKIKCSLETLVYLSKVLCQAKEEIPSYMFIPMRNIIISYMSEHLDEIGSSNLYTRETHDKLGFGITNFKVEDIIQSLKFDTEKIEFESNLAVVLISPNFPKTEEETNKTKLILKNRFINAQSPLEKKTIAEYYFCYDSNDFEIFRFYSEFLIEKEENPINGYLPIREKLLTTNERNIPDLKKLWAYSRERCDKKNHIIRNCVQTSFFRIASNAQSREKLTMITSNIQELIDEYNDIEMKVLRRNIILNFIDTLPTGDPT